MTSATGLPIVGMEPGIFQGLDPGEDVTFSDSPQAQGYGDFMYHQLRAAAVAADVPYEVLTGDMRAGTDRTVRVILNEFRRRIEQRQHHVVAFQFCRPVWEAWFTQAVISGALKVPAAYYDDPKAWRRAEWTLPTWPYIHPVDV